MVDVEMAREQQEQHHAREMAKWGKKMAAIDIGDCRYEPPKSDNPQTWCPVLKYTASEMRYLYSSEVWAHLSLGHRPFYCGFCEKRPGPGYKVLPCFNCFWEHWGYDESLRRGRALSKRRWYNISPRPMELMEMAA